MAKTTRANFLKTAGEGLAGLALLPLTGCASKLAEDLSKTPAQRRGYATVEEAMEVLGTKDPRYITSINGYQMYQATADELKSYAELLAKGNASVRHYIGKDGINTPHTHSYWTYTPERQEILEGLIRDADPDGNMVIDEREIWRFSRDFD